MKAIYIFLVVLIIACGGSEQKAESDYDRIKIQNWQDDEDACDSIESECIYSGNLLNDIRDTIYSHNKIWYKHDEEDNWKTSCQTAIDGFGDCEDIAIYWYRVLIDSCLTDFYDIDIRLLWYRRGDSGHVSVIVYSNDHCYEIFNGNVVDMLDSYDMIAEFDMFEIFHI